MNKQQYVNSEQTKIFDEYGVFFAFSNEQVKRGLEKNKVRGIDIPKEEYRSMGAGMVCPKDSCKTVADKLEELHKQAIELDKSQRTKEKIIGYELRNHEYGITYELEDTIMALDGYGYSVSEIKEVADNIDWSY